MDELRDRARLRPREHRYRGQRRLAVASLNLADHARDLAGLRHRQAGRHHRRLLACHAAERAPARSPAPASRSPCWWRPSPSTERGSKRPRWES
jgi:hypothetical protein